MQLDGREYPPGVVWDCQDAFVIEGKALARIADEQPVSLSTLKRWSVDFGWVALREDWRRKESEIRTRATDARLALITKVAEAKDPMAAFGYSSLEGTLLKARELALREEALKPASATRPIETNADAMAALREAVELKLAKALQNPSDMDVLKLVKQVKEAMDLLAELAPKEKDADTGDKGLSEKIEALFRENL